MSRLIYALYPLEIKFAPILKRIIVNNEDFLCFIMGKVGQKWSEIQMANFAFFFSFQKPFWIQINTMHPSAHSHGPTSLEIVGFQEKFKNIATWHNAAAVCAATHFRLQWHKSATRQAINSSHPWYNTTSWFMPLQIVRLSENCDQL